MEYINRLDKFDGLDIAAICVSENLFEEAFVIYKKFDDKPKAIGVLVENLQDLDRAKDYATACNLDTVWSSLAKAQLEAGKVTDAVDSYVKANDPSEYSRVIDAAQNTDEHHALIGFLQMARKKDFGTQVCCMSPPCVTQMYAYCFCQFGRDVTSLGLSHFSSLFMRAVRGMMRVCVCVRVYV